MTLGLYRGAGYFQLCIVITLLLQLLNIRQLANINTTVFLIIFIFYLFYFSFLDQRSYALQIGLLAQRLTLLLITQFAVEVFFNYFFLSLSRFLAVVVLDIFTMHNIFRGISVDTGFDYILTAYF